MMLSKRICKKEASKREDRGAYGETAKKSVQRL